MAADMPKNGGKPPKRVNPKRISRINRQRERQKRIHGEFHSLRPVVRGGVPGSA